MSSVSPLQEPLLNQSLTSNYLFTADNSVSQVEKAKATVLTRINELKTSKNFLDECTYFISLKGNDDEADEV